MYTGGLLPRPEGKYEDIPVKMPEYKGKTYNAWSKERALFGQNDYIDILGDGTIHPYQLMKGPLWLRGFKGNEMQRLIRRMKFEGKMLKDQYPTKYHKIRKQIWFLYKKYNQQRRHAPFRSGHGSKGRIEDIRDKTG